MAAYAFEERDETSAHSIGPDDDFNSMFPGERIGKPVARRGFSPVVKAWGLILLLAGGGGVLVGGDGGWLDWSPVRLTAPPAPVGPASTEPRMFSSPTTQDATGAQQSIEQPFEERDHQSADAPQMAAAPYATSASEAPASQDQAVATLEPPQADKDDQLQARALAAGLHPRLSRSLLSQLSAEDYRNARQAIEKAVADTPDDGQLAWPRSRAPGLALFQVHFVAGAAPTCRRYVVTVTKDGWSTTALPMERCGARPDMRRAG